MLNLNYYFVDVGENSCYIEERELGIDLRKAFKSKDKARLMLAREYITRIARQTIPWTEEEEFKIVFVNKQEKLYLKADITDSETHMLVESPTVSTKKHKIFFINPGQELNIECQVFPRETEIRSIEYDRIRTTCNTRYMRFK